MKRKLTVLFSSVAMLFFILDTKTMVIGATEAITLCLQTVVPSLFPFILLSSVLSASVTGFQIPHFGFIGRILRIPQYCESIFAIGMFGGYPAGAQAVAQAVERDNLSPADGQRMLLFCNNAGPSFIFGIGLTLFQDPVICWYIWIIQMISAWIIGILTPGVRIQKTTKKIEASHTISALSTAIRVMALISGWVIIFRVGLTYATKYLLSRCPAVWQALISGTLELTNGCIILQEIPGNAIRFILFSAMLAFGGLCVTMQTCSVLNNTGLKISVYCLAKIAQSIIAATLASLVVIPLFHCSQVIVFFLLPAGLFVAFAYHLLITRFLQNFTGNHCTVVV